MLNRPEHYLGGKLRLPIRDVPGNPNEAWLVRRA
jgi:hypothetical protein